jgi:hypothetical protein
MSITATRTGAWDQPVSGGDFNYVAGGAIKQWAAVKADSTEGQVVETGAITDIMLGIAQTAAASGETVVVRRLGASPCLADGALTYGAEVMPSASGGAKTGQVKVAAGATARTCGVVEHAAADQEQGTIFVVTPGKQPPNA